SNINAGKDQLLQLILVGQPQLKGLLNRPELVQLAQRVGSDFHLTPLSRDEVHAYIETRLAIAGCRRRVFTDRAIDLIAEKSRGVPRIINVIADTALVYAFSSEELVVGVESIRSVIRDKTDYGVFGLAADEETAPPIKPTKDDAIDKFSLQTDRAPTPGDDGSASQSTGGRGNPSDTIKPKQPVIGEQPIVSATAQTKTLTDVAASVKAPAEKPEAVQTATAGKTVAREESAITGIVVVGEDPKISPEATIRSAGDGRAIVYVLTKKSPTTVEIARKAGAVVVEHAEKALNSRGRARNAGYRQLKKIMPHLQYVQFIDAGDAVDPDWISNAERFMARRPEVTIVEGVVQKGGDKQSNQSVLESAEPIGETQSISTGAAFMRADAFEAVGGFRGDLATASFVDLCIRQRRRGGRIWRTEKPMIISRKKSENLSSWWSKKVDGGFRSAFLASLHGGPPERLGVMETIGNIFWGFAFPAAIFVFSIFGVVAASKYSPGMPWYFIIAVIFGFGAAIYGVRYILQVFAGGIFKKSSWANAFGDVLGKLPEFFGVLKFLFNKKARAA
ncbi:MAG: hypothetical protein HKP25_03290, partial [Marinicaulis sp.]|nr:hypothetical protein [Marinicaulis sp.]